MENEEKLNDSLGEEKNYKKDQINKKRGFFSNLKQFYCENKFLYALWIVALISGILIFILVKTEIVVNSVGALVACVLLGIVFLLSFLLPFIITMNAVIKWRIEKNVDLTEVEEKEETDCENKIDELDDKIKQLEDAKCELEKLVDKLKDENEHERSFCKYCGAEIPSNRNKCQNCGAIKGKKDK